MDETAPDLPGDLGEIVSAILARPRAIGPADPAELVRDIQRADELGRLSQLHLQGAVRTARANGVSWQQIGDGLGISRQAAFKRFGSPQNTTEGDPIMSQPIVNLVERTERVFQSLSEGDYATVKSMMTFTCSRVLSKNKMMGVWKQVLSSTGELESLSGTSVQTLDGRSLAEQLWNQHLANGVVGQTQLNHEAGEWKGRVAFSGTGKITGILIVSPEATNLPF